MIKWNKNSNLRRTVKEKGVMKESVTDIPWGEAHERDYRAITSMPATILSALTENGQLTVAQILALAPSDTELDEHEIVLNALDELRASGRIRRVLIPQSETGGEGATLGYEFGDNPNPAATRRRALAYLAMMRSMEPLDRGDLSSGAERLLGEVIAERKQREA